MRWIGESSWYFHFPQWFKLFVQLILLSIVKETTQPVTTMMTIWLSRSLGLKLFWNAVNCVWTNKTLDVNSSPILAILDLPWRMFVNFFALAKQPLIVQVLRWKQDLDFEIHLLFPHPWVTSNVRDAIQKKTRIFHDIVQKGG